ncbi:MAG: helix-turn-helix domain-containing protein, partial [Bdellovibrionales bacterium]|nr:helix-turn-helix domain-containing protein [Bdellovibrionales bacterium]
YSKSEVYLELARQLILRGRASDARLIIDEASQTIYQNQNQRQLVRYNHRFAYLLFLRGESHAALALARSVKTNLNPQVDTIFFRQLEGLEHLIEKHLKHFSPAPKKMPPVNFLDRRIMNRENEENAEKVNFGEDPIGDLMDQIFRQRQKAVPEILKSGLLGLLPMALNLPVGKSIIFLGPVRGQLIVSSQGDVHLSEVIVTTPMARLLKMLEGGVFRKKQELVESVWGYTYDSLYHDKLLHATIGKLRRALSQFGHWIEWGQEGYRLNQEVSCLSSENSPVVRGPLDHQSLREVSSEFLKSSFQAKEIPLNRRQVLALSDMERGKIYDVVVYSKRYSVSKITATRDLSGLFQAGLVDRLGKGRATCYLRGVEFKKLT